MYDTLLKGDTTELKCLLDFQSRGYYCSVPFSGSCIYDVIVDINGKLKRIQCKTSRYYNGTLIMNCCRQTTNTIETRRYKYKKEDFDYYYTYYNDYGFLFPNNGNLTAVQMRIDAPNSAFQDTINVGADYLLDNVLYSIIHDIPIRKYIDRRIYSICEGQIKYWSREDLHNLYTDKQIQYIKSCVAKNKKAYGMYWYTLDYPNIDDEYKKLEIESHHNYE